MEERLQEWRDRTGGGGGIVRGKSTSTSREDRGTEGGWMCDKKKAGSRSER